MTKINKSITIVFLVFMLVAFFTLVSCTQKIESGSTSVPIPTPGFVISYPLAREAIFLTWIKTPQKQLFQLYVKSNVDTPMLLSENVSLTMGDRFLQENGTLWEELISPKIIDKDVSWFDNSVASNVIKNDHAYYLAGEKVCDNAKEVKDGKYILKTNNTLWELSFSDNSPKKLFDHVKVFATSELRELLVILNDNSLWAYGSNMNAFLGNGKTKAFFIPVKVMDNVKEVKTVFGTQYVIKTDNTLWIWGRNTGGQVGDGTHDLRSKPIKIMENVRNLYAYGSLVSVLQNDGKLYVWGEDSAYPNNWGKSSFDPKINFREPHLVSDAVKYICVDVPSEVNPLQKLFFIKSDNSLWSFDNLIPTKLLDRVKSFKYSYLSYNAILEDNSLWSWGDNSYICKSKTPIKVADNVDSIIDVTYLIYFTKQDGMLYKIGKMEGFQNYNGVFNIEPEVVSFN